MINGWYNSTITKGLKFLTVLINICVHSHTDLKYKISHAIKTIKYSADSHYFIHSYKIIN